MPLPTRGPRDTGDILEQAAKAGHDDPEPQPVQPGDPDWVEPYAAATPVPDETTTPDEEA
jgi:hypothetical protein